MLSFCSHNLRRVCNTGDDSMSSWDSSQMSSMILRNDWGCKTSSIAKTMMSHGNSRMSKWNDGSTSGNGMCSKMISFGSNYFRGFSNSSDDSTKGWDSSGWKTRSGRSVSSKVYSFGMDNFRSVGYHCDLSKWGWNSTKMSSSIWIAVMSNNWGSNGMSSITMMGNS